ncbi:MAG: hypothetical protein IJZ60_04730 [Bacteroides sp.]|nr:hypothetical protein [Bacteroides sp.]
MSRSGRNKKNDNRPKATAEDRIKYQDAWAKMMVSIWREKIERLHVIDTYRLHQDMNESLTTSGSELSIIQHKFMEYGIYQDVGTGNGYSKGNGGYLEFLDPANDNGQKHRQPREWFSRAYFASVMVLKEEMAYMYGEEFTGLLVEKIEEANRKRSTSMRSRLWGSRKH